MVPDLAASPTMAPIPIYSQSPISPAKFVDGVTPRTTASETPCKGSAARQIFASTTLSAQTDEHGDYSAAQPGPPASSGLATGPAGADQNGPLTPTQAKTRHRRTGSSPTRPVAWAAPGTPSSKLYPPPAAGKPYQPPVPASAPQPPTLRYAPEEARALQPLPFQLNTSTASTSLPPPTFAQRNPEGSPGRDSSPADHPPGYQQNVNASEFSSHQRAAHHAQVESEWHWSGMPDAAEDDEGVWHSAVKWAQSAGEKLKAAETEVWRRVNKD